MRTYRDAEAGKSKLSHDTLLGILAAVNSNIGEYEAMLFGVDLTHFWSDRARIGTAIFNREYKKAGEMLDTLMGKPYCNMEMRTVKQAVMLMEGMVLSVGDKDSTQSLVVLCEAFKLTTNSKLFKKDRGDLVYRDIHLYDFTKTELMLLKEIASAEYRCKNFKVALGIESALYTYLATNDKYFSVKKTMIAPLAFNLTKHLIETGKHKDSTKVLDDTILFIQEVGEYKMLGKLMANKAWALCAKKDKNGEACCKAAYDKMLSLEQHASAESFKSFIYKEYNIQL